MVQASIETAALRRSFWATVLTQFAIGLPGVLGMFGLAVFARCREERFHEETARRQQAENALKQAQRQKHWAHSAKPREAASTMSHHPACVTVISIVARIAAKSWREGLATAIRVAHPSVD